MEGLVRLRDRDLGWIVVENACVWMSISKNEAPRAQRPCRVTELPRMLRVPSGTEGPCSFADHHPASQRASRTRPGSAWTVGHIQLKHGHG